MKSINTPKAPYAMKKGAVKSIPGYKKGGMVGMKGGKGKGKAC